MLDARTATAIAGLGLSVAVSVAAWVLYDVFVLFLLVPFVPLLFRRSRPPRRECPVCSFGTRDPDVHYCPRDGSELE